MERNQFSETKDPQKYLQRRINSSRRNYTEVIHQFYQGPFSKLSEHLIILNICLIYFFI